MSTLALVFNLSVDVEICPRAAGSKVSELLSPVLATRIEVPDVLGVKSIESLATNELEIATRSAVTLVLSPASTAPVLVKVLPKPARTVTVSLARMVVALTVTLPEPKIDTAPEEETLAVCVNEPEGAKVMSPLFVELILNRTFWLPPV
jgi:hypothetical protein